MEGNNLKKKPLVDNIPTQLVPNALQYSYKNGVYLIIKS